ncbi:tumor necrosis factor a (TNF superfamily, member 2) [Alosa sapidissima]|uniref:tumor necrosis factor a (TNF superfamily, member 2) n=1 Tax=Alosa sapidissima TaxID=34773 RepID=UPI001C08EA45|nr:tumor necrosis factor a (TNF superfamily, member 2) [Alosa sapidissima]
MAQDWKSADLEIGQPGVEAMEEQTKMGASRPSGGWKIGLALLAIGLCAASAIFFTIHNQKQNVTQGSEVLGHTLRQLSKRHTGTSQIAIHLEGDTKLETGEDANEVQWKDDVDHAFHHGGLKLVDNEIVIPKKGLYFVYSQVSFDVDCGSTTDHEHPSHAVRRKSKVFEGEHTLLNTMRSSCQGASNDHWYGAINLGAVFSLEEGDLLSTTTGPMPFVEESAGKTFFGVFAL